MVRALVANQPVAIRYPNASRPWQHVLQALDGYLTLAARLLTSDDPQFCSGWNIGPLPGDELAVRDLVEHFLRQWGAGSWRDASDRANVREANTLRLNIDKAMWRLGWQPRWSLKETLQHTVEWYRRYYQDSSDMQQLCIEQIAAYEAAGQTDSQPKPSEPRETPTERLRHVAEPHAQPAAATR
jgi:CDP-glucose 4,6-dehydratase